MELLSDLLSISDSAAVFSSIFSSAISNGSHSIHAFVITSYCNGRR